MANLGSIGDNFVDPMLSSDILNLDEFSFTGNVPADPLLYSTISNSPSLNFTNNSYDDNLSSPILTSLTPLGSGQYTITGTVKNSNLEFVARTVIAIGRETGIIYDKVLSDSSTGEFTLHVPNVTCVVYCLPDQADGVNAEIFDLITPSI